MRFLTATGILMLLAMPAFAQEPRGCDKFAWPLEVEKQALAGPDKQVPAEGAELDRASSVAIAFPLAALKDARLVRPPERAPKRPDAYAGLLSFAAGSVAGKYKVTLSDAGWIDVIQDGQYLKPAAFTGALDCPGLRKSVQFDIGPEPFTLQLSDVPAPTISVVLTPSD